MTLQIDDAGVGDLLLGAVIGVYRPESDEFSYDMVEIEYFTHPRFRNKHYLRRTSEAVSSILERIKIGPDEEIQICSSFILEQAAKDLSRRFGEERVKITKITGEAQKHTETAYLDEIRNIGYEPLADRETRRARSFFHMLRWVKDNPTRMRYVKTGWPKLRRYIRVRI